MGTGPSWLTGGRQRQAEIYVNGLRGKLPIVPADPARLEARARESMSAEGFAYFAGGAGVETTMAANRADFDRWRIVPRMLRDVSVRDTSIELFGRRLPHPFLVAPIGALEMAHPQADLAVSRAAATEGVPMIFSSQGSVPMETCAAAMGDAPRWFQLYCGVANELVASFIQRAEACGCEAIVATLDTTMLGWRQRDLDLGFLPFLHGKGIAQYTSDPVFQRQLDDPPASVLPQGRVTPAALRALVTLTRRYPGPFWSNIRSSRPRDAIRLFLTTFSRPSLTWDDLAFLREQTRLPLLLKGILHPEDARRALELGIDGIVVSNHGGRQVDGAISSIAALPPILDVAADRVPVLLDSGIRGGADVFKALALGARAVLLGRTYAYGLAIAGETGVREVMRNVAADFDLTMGLAGCATVSEIGRENLVDSRG